MRRLLALAGLVGGAVLPLSGATPAAAAGGPTVTALRFGASTVTVDGLFSRSVQVVVELSDTDGVKGGTDIEQMPRVVLQRTGGSAASQAPDVFEVMSFQLVAGDEHNGTWAASWPVLSAYDGTWEPIEVLAEDKLGNTTDVDPRTQGFDPTLTVHGVQFPELSLAFTPAVVHRGDRLTMTGTLRLDDGQPVSAQVVLIGADNTCGADGYGVAMVTSSTGRVVVSSATDVANVLNPYPHCVTLLLPGDARGNTEEIAASNDGEAARASAFIRAQYALLSTHPGTTTVPAGAADAVTGSLWPFGDQMPRVRIVLQRLVGNTWRTVNQAWARASGRFTLTANPPVRGRNVYRVVKPGDFCGSGGCTYLGTASAAFVITGT